MGSLEQEVGYIKGVVEEIREDRKEFLREMHEIKDLFKEHTKADQTAFKEQSTVIRSLEDKFLSQRGYIAGAAGVTSLVIAGVGMWLKYGAPS